MYKTNLVKTFKMLGICPNCKIKLKEPPFNGRETNEVMLVMNYRFKIDNKIPIKSFDEIGTCEICNATKEDFEQQNLVVMQNQ